MTTGQKLLVLAVSMGIASTAWAESERSLGLTPLAMDNVPRSTEKAIIGQLRGTLAAISGVTVSDVALPKNASASDVAALRTAAQAMMVDRLVGGEVRFLDDDTGVVRLVSVDFAGGEPVVAERKLPTLQHEEILSAIGATVCEVLGEMSSADGCQGHLAIEGDVPGAELIVDEVVVQEEPFIGDVPVPLGAHKVQLRAGPLTSQERRIHVHYGSAVQLRIQEHCNQLFVLGHGEEPGCGETLPLVILNPDMGPQKTSLRIPGIATAAAGIALIAGGVYFGMQANARANDIASAYNGGIVHGGVSDLHGAQREMRSLSNTANALYGAGGLLAAVGAGLFFIEF